MSALDVIGSIVTSAGFAALVVMLIDWHECVREDTGCCQDRDHDHV